METQCKTLGWPESGIRCPHCGNDGRSGAWERNADAPFRVIEHVARTWEFVPKRVDGGSLVFEVEVGADEGDLEIGVGVRVLCLECFAELEIDDGTVVDFG